MAAITLGRCILLVHDYDDAYNFYHRNLQAHKLYDATEGNQRYLHLGFGPGDGPGLWLLQPSTEQQKAQVGRQTAGQPLCVFYTADLAEAYSRLQQNGARIVKEPENTLGARFLHFLDLYGNELVLVQFIS